MMISPAMSLIGFSQQGNVKDERSRVKQNSQIRNPPHVNVVMTNIPEKEDFHIELKKRTLPISGFRITKEVQDRQSIQNFCLMIALSDGFVFGFVLRTHNLDTKNKTRASVKMLIPKYK